jgi:hypothetical protein
MPRVNTYGEFLGIISKIHRLLTAMHPLGKETVPCP